MTNREILLKAIRKAEAHGFKLSNNKHTVGIEEDLFGLTPEDPKLIGYESIIFDTDFAAAFFGTKLVCSMCGKSHKKLCGAGTIWMGHGEGMYIYALKVLASDEDNRFKYLEKFL